MTNKLLVQFIATVTAGGELLWISHSEFNGHFYKNDRLKQSSGIISGSRDETLEVYRTVPSQSLLCSMCPCCVAWWLTHYSYQQCADVRLVTGADELVSKPFCSVCAQTDY